MSLTWSYFLLLPTVGFFQEGPGGCLYEGSSNIMSMNMSGSQTLQPLSSMPMNTVNTSVDTSVYKRENLVGHQTNSTLTMTGNNTHNSQNTATNVFNGQEKDMLIIRQTYMNTESCVL